MLAAIFGISTAICWGIGDFIGGSQSRRVGAYGMTLGTIGSGLLMLLAVTTVFKGYPITFSEWLLCMLAGAFDAIGILLLYLSMTKGRLSLAAPVSAVTAAALPVMFGVITLGMPKLLIIMGLILALVAIWMVSQEETAEKGKRVSFAELKLPLLSGLCLGTFLILMHTGSGNALLWPMVAVRMGGVTSLLLLLLTPLKSEVRPTAALPWLIIIINAILDVGGNGCFILAGQLGRIDVAAVLSSLYPGATVFMAWMLLKETITRIQLVGITAALAAIILLTI